MKIYTRSQNHYHIRIQWYLFGYREKCHVESAQEPKMHVELARMHLKDFFYFFYFFYLATHLMNVSLKRKPDKISIITWRITSAERTRAVGMLQQYVSITLVGCIGHRSMNARVRNAWRPENDEFSLVYRKLPLLSAGDRNL